MKWSDDTVNIHIFDEQQAYFNMWDQQKLWVEEIDKHERKPSLLLLEHNHVYTFGRSGHDEHLLISKEQCEQKGIEVAYIDRGGDITYHGPGQLVGYPLLPLNRWKNDAHLFLRKLEEALIQTLAQFGLEADRKPPHTGVWVQDEKIAAIGVKFNRGRQSKSFITSHGFALNINTDLAMFQYIIPCGIRDYGVTSMEKCVGHKVDIKKVQQVFIEQFTKEFDMAIAD